MLRRNDDSDSEGPPLPPIPVPDPNLGSPYENVRLVPERSRHGRHVSRSHPAGSGVESSPGTSPTHHWDYYPQHRDEVVSAMSV